MAHNFNHRQTWDGQLTGWRMMISASKPFWPVYVCVYCQTLVAITTIGQLVTIYDPESGCYYDYNFWEKTHHPYRREHIDWSRVHCITSHCFAGVPASTANYVHTSSHYLVVWHTILDAISLQTTWNNLCSLTTNLLLTGSVHFILFLSLLNGSISLPNCISLMITGWEVWCSWTIRLISLQAQTC